MTSSINTEMATIEQRLTVLTKVREVFPDAAPGKLMGIVEWIVTGAMPLNPAALEVAAKRLAAADDADWNAYHTDRNRYRGMVATTLDAYFAATHR
ncbi:hypothetical protein BAY61_31905 (plasmid) [Prauserella marina]|uniref:Uncharacterized protein n=1 Tax=Prauserella marina TaxID=530584 RepID=A0A222W1P2_9PSEU|nr:hypothetical protein [Prauserella marina]ASR39891.1 hypothetical protein BAY61_31905 [Prauserella marina]PWV71388.1 hypothetical protein DES30_112104 [Prauserella marina]SDD95216.1 hypothetical protein SAMN05421630_1158 [Prauserella marina]